MLVNQTLIDGPSGELPNGVLRNPFDPATGAELSRTYAIYDLSYSPRAPEEWPNLPVQQTAFSRAWSEPDSFDHSNFIHNIAEHRAANSPWAAVCFFALLLASVVLLVIAAAHPRGLPVQYAGSIWGCVLGIAFFFSLTVFSCFFLNPPAFLKSSTALIAGLALLALIPALIFRTYGAIGFSLAIVIVGLFYHFFTSPQVPYASEVMGFICKRLLRRSIVITLAVSALTNALFSVFFGFLTWFAFASHWNGIIYAAVIVASWLTFRVIGEIAYQICAYFAGLAIFTSGRTDWRGQIPPALGVRRALAQNLGIACVNGVVLPLVGPFYTCAHTTVADLAARLAFLPEGFVGAVTAVYAGIHKIAVGFCVWVDEHFGFIDRRGAVYSALFGVPRREGCRRVAENAAVKYARVFDQRCCIDSLLGFAGLALETTAGFLVWGIAWALAVGEYEGFRDGWAVRRLAGGWAFFTAFGLIHAGRMVVAALVDTLFVCFVESRQKLMDPDFEAWLEGQYREAIHGPARETLQEA